jgi:hypothetical protein
MLFVFTDSKLWDLPSAALFREQEKEAVVFAKEVRKANKLLTRLEEEASAQPCKLFAR